MSNPIATTTIHLVTGQKGAHASNASTKPPVRVDVAPDTGPMNVVRSAWSAYDSANTDKVHVQTGLKRVDLFAYHIELSKEHVAKQCPGLTYWNTDGLVPLDAHTDRTQWGIRVDRTWERLLHDPTPSVAVVADPVYLEALWKRTGQHPTQRPFAPDECVTFTLVPDGLGGRRVEYTRPCQVERERKEDTTAYAADVQMVQRMCAATRTSREALEHKAKEVLVAKATADAEKATVAAELAREESKVKRGYQPDLRCADPDCEGRLSECTRVDSKEGDVVCILCGTVVSGHAMYEGTMPVYEGKVDKNSHGAAYNPARSNNQLNTNVPGELGALHRIACADDGLTPEERVQHATHRLQDAQKQHVAKVLGTMARVPGFGSDLVRQAHVFFCFERDRQSTLRPVGLCRSSTEPRDDTIQQHVAVAMVAALLQRQRARRKMSTNAAPAIVWMPRCERRKREAAIDAVERGESPATASTKAPYRRVRMGQVSEHVASQAGNTRARNGKRPTVMGSADTMRASLERRLAKRARVAALA